MRTGGMLGAYSTSLGPMVYTDTCLSHSRRVYDGCLYLDGYVLDLLLEYVGITKGRVCNSSTSYSLPAHGPPTGCNLLHTWRPWVRRQGKRTGRSVSCSIPKALWSAKTLDRLAGSLRTRWVLYVAFSFIMFSTKNGLSSRIARHEEHASS